MEKSRKGITIAGSLIADVFYKIDTYPKEGLLTNIRETERYVGGSGNLITDLAKLNPDMPVKVSAVVGEDVNGDMLCRRLSEYPNIDLGNVTREGESSVPLVMNAQDTKQRTFFFLPASSDRYEKAYIDWSAVDAEIFHLEYLLLMAKVDAKDEIYGTHGARILHEAQKRGMKTSIDIVSEQSTRAKEIVTCALKYTDFCSINEVEAQAITGVVLTGEHEAGLDIRVMEALKCLKDLGVSTWAVIHSPGCGYGYDCTNNKFVKVSSLKLPEGYIKGTNGAGDAYCSGILYGAYEGMSLEEAMRFATACAACSLSEENGTDGLRLSEDVWELEKIYNR